MERPEFPNIEFDKSWQWPAWKYDLDPEDMFGELWDKYNTIPQPIQSLDAWRYDIQDAAHLGGGSVEEFHRILGQKRAQRLEELYDLKMKIMPTIATQPSSMPSPEFWEAALAYSRNHSIDAVLRLLWVSINATASRPICSSESSLGQTKGPRNLPTEVSNPRKTRVGDSKPKKTYRDNGLERDSRSGNGKYNLRSRRKAG